MISQVCPEKISLIHKNFRKLCNLLVDVDEWGQVIIINMLTRYARTQFVDPNKGVRTLELFENLHVCTYLRIGVWYVWSVSQMVDSYDDAERPFYDDDEETEDLKNKKATFTLDPDHRLLLKNAKPLLQSRNASVRNTDTFKHPYSPFPIFFVNMYSRRNPHSRWFVLGRYGCRSTLPPLRAEERSVHYWQVAYPIAEVTPRSAICCTQQHGLHFCSAKSTFFQTMYKNFCLS